MDNPINYLVEQVCYYFFGKRVDRPNASSLIKIHNENLKENGDITFPLRLDIWQNFFKVPVVVANGLIGKNEDYVPEEKVFEFKTIFKEYGSHWIFPVNHVEIVKDRCSVYLNRTISIEVLLKQLFNDSNDYGRQKKNPNKCIFLKTSNEFGCESNLSSHRAKLIENVLRNVLRLSDWTDVQNAVIDKDVLPIQVISVDGRSPKTEVNVDLSGSISMTTLVKCGIVIDPSTRKLAKITTNEYVKLRSTDMRLMAMHKYGIRVNDDKRFCALIDKLGEAAVSVDFLEVKHSSPVKIIRNGQGSTKGASFILYNSARIETLLRTFDERVAGNLYRKMPDLADVNFSLLTEEEEWQLLYGYILAFPNLIHRCLEQIERGSCATHLIIRYLNGLVATFSIYYRRVRILTETRDHLMPYVFARIYLVKAVREILNRTLALVNIEPVKFM